MSVKVDGEPRGIETTWEAALLLNIGRAAFVIPALPRKGHPGMFIRVKSGITQVKLWARAAPEQLFFLR